MADPIACVPVPVWSGEFCLFGVVLHCHVLPDGSRIIEAQDVEALFGAMERGDSVADEAEMAAFARWQRGMA